jgi:hypothetical protein
MSETTTPTQAALLAKVGDLASSSDLFNLLQSDLQGGNKPLELVASRILNAWWDIQSAEEDYDRAVRGVAGYAARQIEALANGEHTDASWIDGAARKATESQVKLHAAIERFRMFVAVRAAMLEA